MPGTESQAALDSLNRTFPQAGGVTAQVVVVAPEGSSVRDAEIRQADRRRDRRRSRRSTTSTRATSPFDEYAKGVINDDDGPRSSSCG